MLGLMLQAACVRWACDDLDALVVGSTLGARFLPRIRQSHGRARQRRVGPLNPTNNANAV